MIGVYDSGIGGLSILRALRTELPEQDFIYLADSGHGPYGERERDHVIDRAQRVTAHLVGRGVEALVVACNTATAAAIEQLRDQWPWWWPATRPPQRPLSSCATNGPGGGLQHGHRSGH